MKKIICIIFLLFNYLLFSEIPFISEKDIIFEKSDSGYDLYIKKLDGIESILLTESQKDPSLKKTNYGLRTPKFHPCNGNEIRILDNRILQTKYEAFFLVDSTPEPHKELGLAFKFFLPEEVYYGYPWSREGKIEIKPGVKINLRLFEKKFADYSGKFVDQWITLKLRVNPSNYRNNLIEIFDNFSKESSSDNVIIEDLDNYKKFLKNIPKNIREGNIGEIIFIIDTTLSMEEEIPIFKEIFPDLCNEIKKKVDRLRIGFILYKDYGDIYLNKLYQLSDDPGKYESIVKSLYASGGDDIPEAVFEAIYRLNEIDFLSDNRYVFLIGDAPPHPIPRGKISRQDAIDTIMRLKLNFVFVSLPYK
ncbi:MAG TPA: hypothetical protein PLE45_02500 [Spirochaetota bacterium]|nr:hypothetical protein [Spirochaetota bacterium]HOL56153.1 hypothetical protein [Spirochaetota bacterium]HPP05239.1 hypothetical protein [Spirochaetota bacterium]